MNHTFLFHDYETFGTSPCLDRPAQFAAIRSDTDFNIIGEPEVFFCRPADDYLPQPSAVIVTGITPQEAREKGMIEPNFARRIHNLFTVPNTCIVGYNNIRFDDEVTRNIFYRNFYDPYAWSWQNGNSRFDLLNIVRACYALRPEGIVWPKNDDGLPSFRLEHLSCANGIEHGKVHEAMADVYATIGIAKLIKTTQARLFDYLLQNRHKQKLIALIDIRKMKPLVHISGIFGARRGNTSWIVPLAWHPKNRNALIVADLASDLSPLLELDSNTLRQLFFPLQKRRSGSKDVPIKLVHINKCPILVQADMLRPENAERLGINRLQCLENLMLLHKNPEVRAKARLIFSEDEPIVSSSNVDEELYKNFFTPIDRAAMNTILKTEPHNLSALDISFTDPRIEKLMFNYRARNYPDTLDKTEKIRWLKYRREIFTSNFLETYTQELEVLAIQYKEDKEKQQQLKALWQYFRETINKTSFVG